MNLKLRRSGCWLVASLAAGTLLLAGISALAAKPNIVFILTDDLGHGDVGVFFQNLRRTNNVRSEPWHLTPRLDTFAAEGMRLPRHYCPAPVCAPSRASLLLGVHQGHANVRDNQFDKALENNHTLGTVLKQAGYATAAVGKWGLQGSGGTPEAWPAYPTKRGLDYYFGYVRHGDGHEHYPKEGLYRGTKECFDGDVSITPVLDKCYTTDLFTARAKRWIMDHRATNSAQPFFLYLAFDTPHAVLELPTQAYPAGGGTNGGLQWLGTAGQMINTASGRIDSYYHPDYATATWDDDGNPGTPEVGWPDVYKRYATSVRRIDDCVGDLVTLFKHLGIDTNTFVVFTSDNGPSKESYLASAYDPTFFNSFGPHDGIKRDTWEGGVRVGALARWPGAIPGNRVSMIACGAWDWMPTFAEAAGLTAPARSDGVSLLPALKSGVQQKHPLVYLEYYEGGNTPAYAEFDPSHRGRTRKQMQVLFTDTHKGIRYNVTSPETDFEIYDVLGDPKETNNLALNPAFYGLQKQLKERVLQVRRPDTAAPRPYDSAFVPAATNAAFTNGVLGYATYTGSWPWVPDFSALSPSGTGVVAGINLEMRPPDNDFGVAFSGFITVQADADYTFYLQSDGGAHLRIHEATVIDDDFARTGGEAFGTIRLKAGRHPFRLYYRHAGGARVLNFLYSSADISKRPVPGSMFALAGAADSRPQAFDDQAQTSGGTSVSIPVLANDTDDGAPAPLTISRVNPPAAGTAAVSGTQVLYTPGPNFLGTDRFSYTVSDGLNEASAQVRVNVVFTNGSVWFPLNQASGVETRDAGARFSATLLGFADDRSAWVNGRWNKALRFEGGEQVLIGGSYLPPAGKEPRTTAAWIRTTNAGAVIAWGPNSTSRKWHMRLENGTANTGALRIEIGGGYVRGNRDLRDGNWHHVAGVLPGLAAPDSTNILLYVDGAQEALSAATSSPINTDSAAATIGVDSQDRYFEGIIDEVRIYNRALSAGEIQELYAATNQSAAHWHLRYFGSSPAVWTADDDSDGGSRWLEYALGAEPWLPDAARLQIRAQVAGQRVQVSFPRRLAGTHELDYQLLSSSNLVSWQDFPAVELAPEADTVSGFERARFEATATPHEQLTCYVRLAIGWQ